MKKFSVIIPAYGQAKLVVQLVESLKNQTSRIGEIVLMDDCSPDTDAEVFKKIDGVKVYTSLENKGWLPSCNRGAKKTSEDYILLLNSDTMAYPGAVEALAKNLDDGASVCGALLIYPPKHPYEGRVQHAGVAVEVDGYPYHIGSGRMYNSPFVQKWRSISAVTGAVFATTREMWNKIGGFDTRFGRGVFEDVSYCWDVKKLGGEVVYEPRSVWSHWEHASQDPKSNWFSRENLKNQFGQLVLKHGKMPCDDELFYKVR